MYHIIEQDPYDDSNTPTLIGPFNTYAEAKAWKKNALKLGAHPASGWDICKVHDPEKRMRLIEENSDDDEGDEADEV